MCARRLSLDPRDPSPAMIGEAARVLREGGLVAFPTETVYGLGARALDPASVARIFKAKGRPRAHPLIAHVLDEASAQALACAGGWNALASRLSSAFWPGPLTLVVPRAASVPDAIAGGGDSIAVRAPSGAIARALIAAVGEPIAAPSANRYQSLSPTTADHVVKSLGDRVDLVLDGGACPSGIESTVVDVRTGVACILRPGALPASALRDALSPLDRASFDRASRARTEAVLDAGVTSPRPSPGMDRRHYAPRARLVTVAGPDHAHALAASGRARGERVAVVLRGPPLGSGPEGRALPGGDERVPPGSDVRVLPDDPVAFAAALFATLHALDDAAVDTIALVAVPSDEAWAAVADRLRRASEPA